MNREGASEILEEYLRKLGGREALFEEKSKAKSTKKRGRPSGASSTPSATGKRSRHNGHPSESTPPASAREAKSKAWTLPSGSWEEEVESIDACEDEESGSLIIYLNWRNGQKTKHSKEVVYKRCPQKVRRRLHTAPFHGGTGDADRKPDVTILRKAHSHHQGRS